MNPARFSVLWLLSWSIWIDQKYSVQVKMSAIQPVAKVGMVDAQIDQSSDIARRRTKGAPMALLIVGLASTIRDRREVIWIRRVLNRRIKTKRLIHQAISSTQNRPWSKAAAVVAKFSCGSKGRSFRPINQAAKAKVVNMAARSAQ